MAEELALPGVYVHLPFCPYICPYCDFAKWPIRRSTAERYLAALRREIEREAPFDAGTMFFGGGTPNAYDASAVASLTALLREHFDRHGTVMETSIEINPELVRSGDFIAYRDAGITRVSIGVQSFVDTEIRTLGRKHSPAQVARVVREARDASIPSVSLDLIFAVPGQTPASWTQSLESAIELGVDHISTYGLTIEEGTPYGGWQAREPSAFPTEADEAELYERAIAQLEGAGYEHYEISNFAKPGHRSRHNANYWRNGEYTGFGVGAASYRSGERSVHTRSLEAYLGAVEAGSAVASERERLEPLKATGEASMLALRTAQGVDLGEFKERYGIDVLRRYEPVIREYAALGLVRVERGALALTHRGKFLANDVCGAFVTFE
jgi:oxygen-independent coproporphyrinogen-3 oxidase